MGRKLQKCDAVGGARQSRSHQRATDGTPIEHGKFENPCFARVQSVAKKAAVGAQHKWSGGHGTRTRNRFPGTTFPVWPLAIRLPSENASLPIVSRRFVSCNFATAKGLGVGCPFGSSRLGSSVVASIFLTSRPVCCAARYSGRICRRFPSPATLSAPAWRPRGANRVRRAGRATEHGYSGQW